MLEKVKQQITEESAKRFQVDIDLGSHYTAASSFAAEKVHQIEWHKLTDQQFIDELKKHFGENYEQYLGLGGEGPGSRIQRVAVIKEFAKALRQNPNAYFNFMEFAKQNGMSYDELMGAVIMRAQYAGNITPETIAHWSEQLANGKVPPELGSLQQGVGALHRTKSAWLDLIRGTLQPHNVVVEQITNPGTATASAISGMQSHIVDNVDPVRLANLMREQARLERLIEQDKSAYETATRGIQTLSGKLGEMTTQIEEVIKQTNDIRAALRMQAGKVMGSGLAFLASLVGAGVEVAGEVSEPPVYYGEKKEYENTEPEQTPEPEPNPIPAIAPISSLDDTPKLDVNRRPTFRNPNHPSNPNALENNQLPEAYFDENNPLGNLSEADKQTIRGLYNSGQYSDLATLINSRQDILDNIKPQIREIVEGLAKGMILEDTWSLITDDENGESIIEQHTFSAVDNLDEIVQLVL